MAIGDFECKLESCLTAEDGSLVLSLRVARGDSNAARQTVQAIRAGQNTGKERLKTEFSWYREKRSLNANSYFHLLVDKIAKAMQLGADEVKERMVLEYGAIATENGERLVVALPKSANVKSYYPYAKWIGDFTAKNKQQYSQYLFYKQTHTLDRAEMQQLIEGVVYEAKELDIETRTPQELDELCSLWEGK
jgi:hypothetical protein